MVEVCASKLLDRGVTEMVSNRQKGMDKRGVKEQPENARKFDEVTLDAFWALYRAWIYSVWSS